MSDRTFEHTEVWKKAHALVLGIYKLTATFPREELYGLTSQFRRAAVSVPANFAEGYKRRTASEKARFINIAQASLEECRYYLILAQDLGYARTSEHRTALDEVGRMLGGYLRTLDAERLKTASCLLPPASQ